LTFVSKCCGIDEKLD